MAGQRALSLGALALVAASLAGPLVAAETAHVEGDLVSTGPTRILGSNAFRLDAAGLLVQDGPADLAFGLDAAGAEASLVVVQTQQLRLPSGTRTDPVRGEERVVGRTELTGALAFAAPAGLMAPVIRVLASGEPLGIGLSASREIVIGSDDPLEPFDQDTSLASSATLVGQSTRPAADGAYVTGLPATLSWDQPFTAFLSGGRVSFADGTGWEAGRFLNASASAVDPTTGSGRYVYDHYIVAVQGRGAVLDLAGASAAWTAAVSGLAGTLDGDVAWTGVDADVRSRGERLPADPRLFQLRGQLWLDAAFAQSDAWHVSGQASFINVDGRSLPTSVAATAAAGAGLLAGLLLLLSEPGRAVLGLVLGRHAPRLVKAAPLGNPSRQRILKAIHTSQPVRIAELRQATGLTKTALAYHLRILLAYEVIQQTKGDSGRNTAFMLNSGSLAFRVFGDGEDAPADDEGFLASEALAAVNSHPVRLSIHSIVQANGPVSFEGINRERVARGEPALVQSSATHHLQLLEKARALRSRRDGRRKVYEAAIDAREARVEQYRRFLGQVRATALVQALAAGPATSQDVLERLGPTAGRRERRTLERLAALGLVEFDPSRRTYHLAGFLIPLVPLL
jgi:predicted transcriptional regulator